MMITCEKTAMNQQVEFCDLLEKSNLLSSSEVEDTRNDFIDAQTTAMTLIESGKLTRWQVKQLLGGRHIFYLGKYKLLDKLGEGGMGAVYKAEQTTVNRIVAIKLLSEQFIKHPEAALRFNREIQTVSACQ